jgi:predicted SAM-dependent methyltransferase
MKLHLGCGNKHIPGFVHVDMQNYSHVDLCEQVNTLNFAQDNSVELIYASHVLEHFGRHEVDQVLREWFRVLQPGGILRLAVPDFESIVLRYQETRDVNEVMGLVCGGQRDDLDFHKIIFDEKSLQERLRDVGFSSVSRYDWRKTEHSWLDDYSQAYLPHMDKEGGRLMSLNIEAVK